MATYVALKEGYTIHPVETGVEAYEYVVQSADNRLYKISTMGRTVLEELAAGKSLEEISGRLVRHYPGATAGELQTCIVDMYRPFLQFQEGDTGTTKQPAQRKQNALFVRMVVIPEKLVNLASKWLVGLYGRTAACLLIAAIIATHGIFYWQNAGSLRGTVSASTSITLLLCLLSVVAHELGHSSALLSAQARPGGIGVGMFLLMPVFFADVSQVWKLPRRSRIMVDLGGIYFQQITFVLFVIIGAVTHAASFRAACLAIDVMCLLAINPAFRFDGYWVLVDWLEVPKLHLVAQKFLKECVTGLFGKGRPGAILPDKLQRVKMAAFVAYALLGNGFLAAAVLINLRSVRGSMVRAWHAVPEIFHQLTFASQTKDWFTVVNTAVSLWFIFAFVVAITVMSSLYTYRGSRALAQWSRSRIISKSPSADNVIGDLQ